MNRTLRICSPEVIDEELASLRTTLLNNGYPETFIAKNMVFKSQTDPVPTVSKKPLYISLPFRSDTISEQLYQRLSQSIRRTFAAATLRLHYHSRRLLSMNLKDKLPVHDQSMLVYSFSCCCAAEYVGKTTRCLSKRVREHVPAWINSGAIKTIRSAVLGHLVDTNHQIKPNEAFKIVYKVPIHHPPAVRKRMLATAESIAIRLRNPVLCSQKQFVQTLQLPWSIAQRSHEVKPNNLSLTDSVTLNQRAC